MNGLAKFLVDSILNEDENALGSVALFGGGFKPPTKGHLDVVLQGLRDNPEVKQVYILVGSGVRNGVTQEEAVKIWKMYKKFIPVSTQIVAVQSPFSYIKTYLQDHQDENVYIFIGARPDNDEDEKDVAERSAYAKKYSEKAFPVKVTTPGNVSGTQARAAAITSKEDFLQFIPSKLTDSEKESIYQMVADVVKEKINENASYSSDINVKEKILELTKHMLAKGMNIKPLPKVKFVNGDSNNAREFLGKTAYYDPNNFTITLYTEGRHPKDIVRSFSHEMIHHIQNLENRLGDVSTTNTMEDDNIDKLEQEANLKGTMTFRNWTDSLNEGKNKDPFGLNQYARELAKGLEEAIVGKKIECDGCGWGWNIKDGGDDLYICHKCGHDNTPKQLNETPSEVQVKKINISFELFDGTKISEDITLAMSPNSQGVFELGANIAKYTGLSLKDAQEYNETPDDAYAYGLVNTMNDGQDIYFWTNGTRLAGKAKKAGAQTAIIEQLAHEGVHLTRAILAKSLMGDKFPTGEWPSIGEQDNDTIEEEQLTTALSFVIDQISDPFIEMAKEYIPKLNDQSISENLVNEGRYDSLVRQLASITLNSWKDDSKGGEKNGYFTDEITPENYPTDLNFVFKASAQFTDNKPYDHNGYSRPDGEVGVKYIIPKDMVPQGWEEIYMDLVSTIRHEIEHQTQSGKNVKDGKGMESDAILRKLIKTGGDVVRYVTLPKEVDANVNGLYLKAKKWKRPYAEVVDEYIKDFIGIDNPADASYIKNIFAKRAKELNLPNILTEGRYDKPTNEFSNIVFGLFKDIHDRGDKKGEFELSVGPDDEDIYSEEFEFDLAGVVEITDDEYEVNGGANAGFDNKGDEITPLLSVRFKIPKNPDWQRVSFDIKDVVRHELEHLTQDGLNVKGGVVSDDPKLARPSKQMADDQLFRDMIDMDLLPKADYFKLEKEVDAMLQGLYLKAKKSRRPYREVIDDYLSTQPITAEDKEEILNLWKSRGKALSLPLFEQENMGKDYKIYLDMDGVIVDFDKRFTDLAGMGPREYENSFGKEKFWNFIDSKEKGGGVGFWVGMPWMPGGEALYNRVAQHNHALLSSPSRSESSKLGKRLWKKKYTPTTDLILSLAANKKNYANGDSILIDDRESNIQQWREAGGIGILYKSPSQVNQELDKLGL
jgi:phosphopantetheine adenylyltransferase